MHDVSCVSVGDCLHYSRSQFGRLEAVVSPSVISKTKFIELVEKISALDKGVGKQCSLFYIHILTYSLLSIVRNSSGPKLPAFLIVFIFLIGDHLSSQYLQTFLMWTKDAIKFVSMILVCLSSSVQELSQKSKCIVK